MSELESGRPPIAIDGSAVSGKSSAGREFAAQIGYRFLDTGLMYRAATWNALRIGANVNDTSAVIAATEQMEFTVSETKNSGNQMVIDGEDITQHLHSVAVDDSVSAVSAIGRVREIMVAEQRRLAGEGEIVMVGRDIGTVVIPDAPLKIYLTATARTRAIRRHRDFLAEGAEVDFEDILRSLERRDKIDSSRKESPLRPAGDARVIDTEDLSFEQVVEQLVELAKDVL
ncbi:MAG: (d)CMP kinase [Dehalococcoidia bacterium]|nr:(d)CMP kinase [Dehalococcoidia bacterium]MDP7089862.1 (d)CMP kinase [Dehalococcoidia bacterium]MDP7262413.1 (d)CMP kinase [Dehalococcoidia bacterium]MDP7484603.1 (d)CMP kinase [Dehalococcoidia bacterium]